MTVKQAASRLGCSIGSVYKLMATGQLTYLKIGSRKFPLAESVDQFIERNTITETKPPVSKETGGWLDKIKNA